MIKDTLIRTAHSGDANTIARIHVDSWREVYKTILPNAYLRRLSYRQVLPHMEKGLMHDEYIYLIAEELRGAPIGYICGGPERSGDLVYPGEVYELYIVPQFQRHGIGRHLLSALASKLLRRQYYALMAWVLASNPSHQFYEKTGGLYLGAKPITFAGQKLQAAAYGWIDITLAFMDDTE